MLLGIFIKPIYLLTLSDSSVTADRDVPCAVCSVAAQDQLMMSGRKDCPTGYTRAYEGYLMVWIF